MCWRRKWQPTPVFLPGESQGRGGCHLWVMTHDGATDTGCPLKVLHTDAAKRLPLFKGMHRFLPALILLQDGGCYKQVPVRHFPRTAGKSKFHLWNRLAGPFADCFAYRWMKPRYINYKVGETDLV